MDFGVRTGAVWKAPYIGVADASYWRSRDKTLRLWDAKSGRPIGEPLRGHEDAVSSVAFSPDSTRIVSGSGDGTVRLWDTKRKQPIGQPLRGHEGWVSRVAFSADGTRIVGGSEDGTLRLWDAKLVKSADALRALLCEPSHRNLSLAEWKRYVAEGEAYRAVCNHLPIKSSVEGYAGALEEPW